MNDIDKNVLSEELHDEDSLVLSEVIKSDVELYYLHHYLTETFTESD